jgi:hypothetical protein
MWPFNKQPEESLNLDEVLADEPEEFQADPLYTLDDILDGEKYIRVSREVLDDVLQRLSNVEAFVIIKEKKCPDCGYGPGERGKCGAPKKKTKKAK